MIKSIKLISQCRSIITKSERNKGIIWDGSHRVPLTEDQRLRRKNRRKPFVLGRDNVKRTFTPIDIGSILNDDDSDQKMDSQTPIKEDLGFSVSRTQFGALPVYTEYKNGRGRVMTIIRRVEGDAHALKNHVSKFIAAEKVSVNELTQHVVVQGNSQRTLRYWLTSLGF